MPDITMCKYHDCSLKETCYRYTAKPSDYQSYFVGSPKDDDGSCKHYWKIEKSSKSSKKLDK